MNTDKLTFTETQLTTLYTWVQDLHTTQVKQCTGVFREGDAYCALGRLLDVIDPNAWVRREVFTTYTWDSTINDTHDSIDAYEALGLYQPMPGHEYSIVEYTMELNDIGKHSFAHIAERICDLLRECKVVN